MNEKETFVVDAHTLAWFISKDPRISQAASVILRKAENSEVEVLVPTIVLAELLYVAQKKKISLGIEEVLKRIGKGGNFVIVPFDFPIFERVMKLPHDLELHDRIIVATARIYAAKVLTKDEKIIKSGVVQVIW
jgi:PIN domain nuclease of toxin-antitoxin system